MHIIQSSFCCCSLVLCTRLLLFLYIHNHYTLFSTVFKLKLIEVDKPAINTLIALSNDVASYSNTD